MSLLSKEGVYTDEEFDDVISGINNYMNKSDVLYLDLQIKEQLEYMDGHDGHLEFIFRPFSTQFDPYRDSLPHSLVIKVKLSTLFNEDYPLMETVWCPGDFSEVRYYVHRTLIDNIREGERWYPSYIVPGQLKRRSSDTNIHKRTSLFWV